MPTLLLIRHGRTTANATGVLAGWTDGVGLDDLGTEQARVLADRLAPLPVCRVLASPLQRTVETARPIAQTHGLPVEQVEDLGECRYGAWTGRPLADLAREDLWRTVQRVPSAAVFPPSPDFAHEGLAQLSARAVGAVRGIDADVRRDHGPAAIWAAVSHGDVIKAIIADALGLHLDEFQRIHVDPASVSVIRYTTGRPLVVAVNGPGIGLEGLATPPENADAAEDDGEIGGGPGTPARWAGHQSATPAPRARVAT
ncbi:MAG: MSMEG_4193 family putative phosphomutase [Dermatophilaceae bacterium]